MKLWYQIEFPQVSVELSLGGNEVISRHEENFPNNLKKKNCFSLALMENFQLIYQEIHKEK